MRGLAKLAALLAPPDDALLEAGAGGERLVAKTRLVFFGTIALVPIIAITVWPDSPREAWIGLVAASSGLLFSALMAWTVRSGRAIAGLAFLTSSFDVTLVSATLAAFALAGRPHVAVNSLVVWEVYLLAIFATSLRFDLRVCLAAGLLSIALYTALLAWVARNWDLASADPVASAYGPISWPTQSGRLILLVTAIALASGIVLRTRRLINVSGTDRLTGLANRAYLEERLAAELSRSKRTGQPLALAFLDLDRFKQLNDRSGHATGDSALRVVARVLREESRQGDVVARWRGEEFVLVLPGTSLAGGHGQADRIRKRLAATPIPTREGPASLTLSGGCAEFPREAQDAASLIAMADRRLLEAKQAGRDRVVSEDRVSA